jgi:glyoxylase-like metal-dependent hydrolase (beta-lactamase superfamily II)
MGKRQFEFSRNPHYRDRASYIPGLAEKFEKSGRLLLVDDADPQVPDLGKEFSFFFSDGHTPGMLHTLVKGAEHTLLFIADLVPGTLWVHLPVVMGYDRFAEQTVNEKKEVLDRAIAENWYVFYPHDPEVCASRITRNGKGRYEAVEPIKILNKLLL